MILGIDTRPLPAPPADVDDPAAVIDWWVRLAISGSQATGRY